MNDNDEVVTEREIHHTEAPRSRGGFLWGVVTALVVAVIAVVAFLAIWDGDDDGNIDVPSIDVDADVDTGDG